MSIEMQKAFAGDGAVVNDEGTPQMYVENNEQANISVDVEQEQDPKPKTRQHKQVVSEPVIEPDAEEDGEFGDEPEVPQEGSGLFEDDQTEPTPAEVKLDSILDRMAVATNRAELTSLEMEGKQAGLDSAAMTKIRKAYQNRVIELK